MSHHDDVCFDPRSKWLSLVSGFCGVVVGVGVDVVGTLAGITFFDAASSHDPEREPSTSISMFIKEKERKRRALLILFAFFLGSLIYVISPPPQKKKHLEIRNKYEMKRF